METQLNDENGGAVTPRRLKPAFWGAGFTWASFLCAVRFIDFGDGSEAQVLLHGVVFMALGAVAAAVAIALGSVRGRRCAEFEGEKGARRGVLAGSLAICAGSLGLLGWYGAGPVLPAAAVLGLAALLGAGLVTAAVCWGALYARLEPEELLPNGAAALGVGSVAHAVHQAIGLSLAGWALVPLFALAEAWCAVRAGRLKEGASGEDAGRSEMNAVDAAARPELLSRALYLLWMPLAGACISCFIFGLTWDPVVSAGQELRVAHLFPGATATGPVALALMVVLVSSRSRSMSPLRLFNQVVYPLAVMLLLVIPVVNQNFPDMRFLMNILSATAFAVVALCVWSNMAAAVRSVPIRAGAVFSAAFVLFGLCFVAGLYAIKGLGTDGRTLCLVVFAVYLALIAVSFALGSREERAGREERRPADDTRSYIHRRCDEIAAAAALSPRESDVLYYLGRGYNHTYIAKKLYISENTVRTHVRHIYGKLGISSREELIDLVDEPTRPS